MAVITIYDFEPNFDNFNHHQQQLILGIFGFKSLLNMSLNMEVDQMFIRNYRRSRNL